MTIDSELRNQCATNAQPIDPKALARAVLDRNKARNQCATVAVEVPGKGASDMIQAIVGPCYVTGGTIDA